MAKKIPVNPKLPPDFDNTPNDERPASHQRWWNRPYIVTDSVEEFDTMYAERTGPYAESGRRYWKREGRAKWLAAWPRGTRFMVRCLDGGAWDRSTNWGCFATLAEALECAASASSCCEA